MRSDSSSNGPGRLISRSVAATMRTAGLLRVLFTLMLLAAAGSPLMAEEAGGEANLKLPWLNNAPLFLQSLGGIQGRTLLMSGLVEDFNFAARLKGRKEIFSTQLYLPMPPARTSLASFFTPLVNNMERMFLTGKPPYPIERTLLTTGLTAAGVECVYNGVKRMDTPHLAIPYKASPESTFWRT